MTSRKTRGTRRKKGQETNYGKSYLAKDFFAPSIDVDTSKLFPMLVVATMSSGKSTLINALLGQQILPSKNAACTAKMYSILDDDTDNDPKLYITNKDGSTIEFENDIAQKLEEANEDQNVSDIFLRGHIKGVLNTDKALLVVDTPGPNNSSDLSHEKVMREVLNKVNGGLILYVINATQMGVMDDKELLGVLKQHIQSHPNSKIVFAVNKIDEIDEEREPLEEIMKMVKSYLSENGFEDVDIIPVSALAASIFKKVLNKESLTRKEYLMFQSYYDLYQPKEFSMKSFAITKDFPNQFDSIKVRGEEFKISAIERALENTGIRLLEEIIQKQQILSSGTLKHKIKIK